MVRLIKSGRKIQLLPPPSKADEEDDSCPDCKEKFDGDNKRRCCYVRCQHVTCLDCVRKSKTGCGHCSDDEVISSSNVTMNLAGCPPTLTTSCPTGYENGQLDEYDGEPPILEKEVEEPEEDIDVEGDKDEGSVEQEEDQFGIVLSQRRRKASQVYKKNQSQELSSSSRMGRWPCKHCNCLCMSKSALDEHLTKQHSQEAVAVATQKQLKIHLKTQTKERIFRCYWCGQSFNRMFHLVRHMESLHRDQVHLLPPVSSKISGDVCCPVCKTKFQSDKNKKYSLLRRAKNANCDHICCVGCIAKMADGCSLCSAGSSVNFQRLPQKARKVPSFRLQQKQKRHLVARNPNGRFSLATTAVLENNADQDRKGEGTPKDSLKCWKCQRCGLRYCRPYSLQRHVESVHNDIVEVSLGSPTENKGLSHCPKCNVQFEILKHSRFRRANYVQCEHSICLNCLIEEDLTCSQCAGSTSEEMRPVYITRKTHSNGLVRMKADKEENVSIEQEGRLHCLICNFTFSRHLSFERHLGRMHGVELLKSEEQDESANEKKSVEDLYCPECQEEFGPSEENQKAKYTACGHTSCLKCILKAELGCGKCTTENDPRWINKSSLESPSEKREVPIADILSNGESQSPQKSFRRSAGRPPKNFKCEQGGMNSLPELQSSPTKMSLRLRPSNDIQLSSSKIPRNGSTMPAHEQPQSSLEKTNAVVVQNKKENVFQQKIPIYGQAGKNFSAGMKVSRCNYCGKSFMGKRARNLHIQKVHSANRHHVCNYCQWKSQSPRDLQRHILQHTKEKPFKCSLCTAAFTRKFTLKKHVKRMHHKNQRH